MTNKSWKVLLWNCPGVSDAKCKTGWNETFWHFPSIIPVTLFSVEAIIDTQPVSIIIYFIILFTCINNPVPQPSIFHSINYLWKMTHPTLLNVWSKPVNGFSLPLSLEFAHHPATAKTEVFWWPQPNLRGRREELTPFLLGNSEKKKGETTEESFWSKSPRWWPQEDSFAHPIVRGMFDPYRAVLVYGIRPAENKSVEPSLPTLAICLWKRGQRVPLRGRQ